MEHLKDNQHLIDEYDEEFKDLFKSYDEIAIDLETKDPNLKTIFKRDKI